MRNGSKIVAMWSQSSIRWAHAALLFGVCGAVSSQLVNLDGWSTWGNYLLPIPFGIFAAWLCVGRLAPGIALVILDAAVWQLAYRTAHWLATDGPVLQRIAAMYLAGLIGGLGVSVAAALVKREAPPMRAVGISALAGGVCGLPFAWWVIVGNQVPIPEWAFITLCFAIWQAAVGVCLWQGFRLGKPEPAT
ncbi:MAG: hypothetical protein WBL61_02800 [Bryobacteraceae bacterium]